jgi:hypothetical protein
LSPEFKQVQDLCDIVGLKQVIETPTHLNRLIDQIFIPTEVKIDSCGIAPPVERVHALTWAKILLTPPSDKLVKISKWRFHKADWIQMNRCLMEENLLRNIQQADSVNNAAIYLEKSIKLAMTANIPKTTAKHRKSHDWISQPLMELHAQKLKAYRQWKLSSSAAKQSQYIRLSKRLKKEIVIAKKTFFFDSFRKCHDPGSFWKTLNYFTGRSLRVEIPSLISVDGQSTTTDKSKAEVLCQQFVSVFKNQDTQMPNFEVDRDSLIMDANVRTILKKISTTPTRKAVGVDEISCHVLKNCSLVLAPCIAVIVDRCLAEGSFPENWKEAVITPVPKVLSSPNPADYRPVSLLPLISKVIESQFNDIFMRCVDPQLSNAQFGFRRARSTTDAILTLQHHILRGFESCEKTNKAARVAVIYFDIEKAFDTVPHSKLLNYLHHRYKVPTNLMALLKSYLSNRTMRVKIGDSVSERCSVSSGVPQGSVLGPSLFIAYFNHVAELELDSSSQLVLYADDMAFVHPLNEDDSVVRIQRDINRISQRLKEMCLKANAKKCKSQIICLGTTKIQPPTFKLEDVELERVAVYRYLGVEFDERLTFATQSWKAATKTKQAIGALCRTLRKWAPDKVFRKAVVTIALPIFLYAIEVWMPPHVKHQVMLERVIKFAVRLLTNNFQKDISYGSLLEAVGWKPLFRLVSERRLLLIRKYLGGERYILETVFPLEEEP